MATPPTPPATDYSLGFYARQPVFDAKGAVWAYSLYFRDGDMDALPPEAQKAGATNSVVAAVLGESASRRRIVKCASQSLVYELPLLFPAQSLVVEVREDMADDAAAMDALRALKAKGYRVAVSHFGARASAAGLYALADVLFVDALGGGDLPRLAKACEAFPALPGLTRIETREMRDQAAALGFKLFQGNYFQQPETVRTRKLSSSQFSRLKLLQAIEQQEPDLKSLAETIRADVALSYKLFGLLNSAFFSFSCRVESVTQALALLGWEPLRTWIRLVILTDMTPPGKSSELPRSATLRGRFLELVAREHGQKAGPAPENLFLVGLFSLLPALLDQPMAVILDTLRLPAEVSAALLDPSAPAARWLDLAGAFERADWTGVQAAMTALELSPVPVAQAYAQALAWTDALFRGVPA